MSTTYTFCISLEEFERLRTAPLYELRQEDCERIEVLGINRRNSVRETPDREYWVVGKFDPPGSRVCRLCGYDDLLPVPDCVGIPEPSIGCFFFSVMFRGGNPSEVRHVQTLDCL